DIAPGILKSLGLPELAIINADTESSVDVARERAEKLINDGAQLLIGAFDSGQTTAIAQVAEQKGIPFVINIAAAPEITEQGYKFVFRNFPTAQMLLGSAFANQLELFEIIGSAPKTVVFMHINDTFGTPMAKGINAVIPKFNVPYKSPDETYDATARDLSVEVAKAKGTGADALPYERHDAQQHRRLLHARSRISCRRCLTPGRHRARHFSRCARDRAFSGQRLSAHRLDRCPLLRLHGTSLEHHDGICRAAFARARDLRRAWRLYRRGAVQAVRHRSLDRFFRRVTGRRGVRCDHQFSRVSVPRRRRLFCDSDDCVCRICAYWLRSFRLCECLGGAVPASRAIYAQRSLASSRQPDDVLLCNPRRRRARLFHLPPPL